MRWVKPIALAKRFVRPAASDAFRTDLSTKAVVLALFGTFAAHLGLCDWSTLAIVALIWSVLTFEHGHCTR